MRDRLIELFEEMDKNPEITCPKPNDVEACKSCKYKIGDWLCNNLERKVDYLLANGVIVPPCKVGDIVYVEFNEKVVQGTVRLIRPFISKEETVFKGNVICEIDSLFYDDGRKEEHELYVVFEKPYGIERVAYLTKEEAEAKLKECVGND